MLDFARFQALTFDCYGTLINWETGILDVLRPLLAAHGKQPSDAEILDLYAELEPEVQSREYLRYREVLRRVVHGFGLRLGFQVSPAEADSLPDSLKDWEPFADTVPALRRLKQRYKLAVISNIDDDLFALTAKHLEVNFDHVITAQQCRSYKPSLNNFRRAMARMDLRPERILHVAQSLFHDVAPARSLGLASVWVNRRGLSATRPADARPDLEVPDLKTLADLVERSLPPPATMQPVL
ncbi:MAG: haloacid dehalogenase type II [Acidobacteria bacterium]|nr:haloacid dehalogenase type II [Acidobacteriota bacterium]